MDDTVPLRADHRSLRGQGALVWVVGIDDDAKPRLAMEAWDAALTRRSIHLACQASPFPAWELAERVFGLWRGMCASSVRDRKVAAFCRIDEGIVLLQNAVERLTSLTWEQTQAPVTREGAPAEASDLSGMIYGSQDPEAIEFVDASKILGAEERPGPSDALGPAIHELIQHLQGIESRNWGVGCVFQACNPYLPTDTRVLRLPLAVTLPSLASSNKYASLSLDVARKARHDEWEEEWERKLELKSRIEGLLGSPLGEPSIWETLRAAIPGRLQKHTRRLMAALTLRGLASGEEVPAESMTVEQMGLALATIRDCAGVDPFFKFQMNYQILLAHVQPPAEKLSSDAWREYLARHGAQIESWRREFLSR